MSDQELAALGAAEGDIATEQPAEQQVEGQVETPPADGEPEDEKTSSQERRERRKAQEKRLKEDVAEAARRAKEAETRLSRIKAAASGISEPKESDFNDPLEYAAAKGGYHTARMAAQMQTGEVEAEINEINAQTAAKEAEHRQARMAAISEEIPDAKARYADFDRAFAVAQRADVVSPALSDMIVESDKPLDLAYYFGTNPDVARQLSQMAPLAAARELGRIEATLSGPKPKLQSSAPAPITTLKGSGTAVKKPDAMNYKEFKAYREAGGKL